LWKIRNTTRKIVFFKILECNGKITKSEFIDLYSFFFLKDESNIFRYLSRDDLTTILLRADRSQPFENIRTSMEKKYYVYR
ncbi:hypothetical protein, partial [Bifidobacterium longum]|uniref:hypothetical protein n=1 Tax=Bifidobacterium longum TaxID=216816 RepID=UPI001C4E1ED3